MFIGSHAPGKPLYKVVPNTPAGIDTLLTWATDKAQCTAANFYVVLEATGPYHETAAESLAEAGCRVFVVNPARTRDFAKSLGHKTKTDRVDAAVLARYGLERHAELKPWTVQPPQYRALRALQARRQAQGKRNRLEKLQVVRSECIAWPRLSPCATTRMLKPFTWPEPADG